MSFATKGAATALAALFALTTPVLAQTGGDNSTGGANQGQTGGGTGPNQPGGSSGPNNPSGAPVTTPSNPSGTNSNTSRQDCPAGTVNCPTPPPK